MDVKEIKREFGTFDLRCVLNDWTVCAIEYLIETLDRLSGKMTCPVCKRKIICFGRVDSQGRPWCENCTDKYDSIAPVD